MSRKSRGINAERELVHAFWNAGWGAIRVAGSGSSSFPSPDIIAGKHGRILVIECKSGQDSSKYIARDDIDKLKTFARIIGAEVWIGIRIKQKKWVFLAPDDMHLTGKNYVVNKENSELKGLSFEHLTT